MTSYQNENAEREAWAEASMALASMIEALKEIEK